VISIAFDLPEALCVWVSTGSSNSDADFERYLASIKSFDAACRGRDLPAGILIIDAGNPPPNAAWRRRIADETKSLVSRPLFAMVSTSIFQRGAITAINWIRPPPYEFATFDTFEAAVRWIEERRTRKVTVAEKLLAEARAAIDKR
jgi:hypothetical protein